VAATGSAAAWPATEHVRIGKVAAVPEPTKMPSMKSAAAIGILVSLLAACTTIGHVKVKSWPKLDIVEHYVPHQAMRERCAKYTGFLMRAEACAEFDFENARCHIWLSADAPPDKAVVAHERLHCAGYDHVGETSMQALLQRYLARKQNGI
jgi:hypothetical protein